MDERRWDAIVVGAGIAGLAAAALVARQGKRVLLLEQSKSVGGRAKSRVRDGFHFNLGAHALYQGGPAEAVLRELGVRYGGSAPPLTGQLALKNGKLHTFPTGTVSLLTTDLLGLSSKLEAARMLSSVSRIHTDDIMDVPLAEWVDNQISHPEVRSLLLAVFRLTTYVNAPDKMSAGCAVKQLQMALDKGVVYMDNGWQTLVDGLRQAAEREDVIIRTRVRAEAIERALAGAAAGVRLSTGDCLEAPVVIIASSPPVASALAGSAFTESAKWAEESVAVRAACMDVALERLPRPRTLFALGIDKPLYFSVHSASARLAPEGGALLHMIWYSPSGTDESPERIKREFDDLLDLTQPGWRDVLVHCEFLPGLLVSNRLPEARTSGTALWPGPAVPEVPGLFLAGDWVGGRGMLADAALGSARQAATLIANSAAGFAVAV
jgi:phytoene dehydrogenase-like protein